MTEFEIGAYAVIVFGVGFILGGFVMFAILMTAKVILLKIPSALITPQELNKMYQRDQEIRNLVNVTKDTLAKLAPH